MLDEKDKKILNLLNSQPTITKKKIAKSLNFTPAAVNNRLQRMKKKKIILGNTPLLDLHEAGYQSTVLVQARVKNGKLKAAAEKWGKNSNVCALYRVSGDYDLIIIAKFHNTKDLDKWNQEIFSDTELIERTDTRLVFGIEKEGSNPNKID